MRQPVKLVMKKEKLSKNGTHTVFIQYCYTSVKRVLIGTGISIPQIHWDTNACSVIRSLPAEYGGAEFLQNKLNQQRIKAEKISAMQSNETIRVPWNF